MKNYLYRLKKKLWPKLVILCYHRVSNYKTDPVNITVSKNNFLNQIEFLKHNTKIIHPQQLFDSLKQRKNLPKRSVLLTFDDGYSSYEQTMQTLFDNSISAIFFISSKKYKFWWDVLSSRLLEPKTIDEPDYKTFNKLIKMVGKNFKIEKELDINALSNIYKWKTEHRNFPFNRCRAYQNIAKKMEKINPFEKNDFFFMVNNLSEEKRNLSYLSNNNLIKHHTIGAHTINHYDLAKLDYENQKEEIEGSKLLLEKYIKDEVNVFSYPFGMRYHYNDNTINLVKNNFQFAFSGFQGLVHKDSNMFELPRFLVRDWSANEFELRLNNFFKI